MRATLKAYVELEEEMGEGDEGEGDDQPRPRPLQKQPNRTLTLGKAIPPPVKKRPRTAALPAPTKKAPAEADEVFEPLDEEDQEAALGIANSRRAQVIKEIFNLSRDDRRSAATPSALDPTLMKIKEMERLWLASATTKEQYKQQARAAIEAAYR